MSDSLMQVFGMPGVSLPPEDFWLVHRREGGAWAVTPETAKTIAGTLDRRMPPRWVTFTDVAGAVVRVRIRSIAALEEFTSVQRARAQAFWRRVEGVEGESPMPWH
jgi:hypothetical protein